MATAPDLSDSQAAVLRAVHAEGSIDLYALAQAVGKGPRAAQEAVRALSRDGLVHVSEQGRRVSCTRHGDETARALD